MPTVEIAGWSPERPGFRKVECTTTLQSVAGLGLAQAKRVTDSVLVGQSQRIELPSIAIARQLAAMLQELGASAHVVQAP